MRWFQRWFQFWEKPEIAVCQSWAIGGLSHLGDLMFYEKTAWDMIHEQACFCDEAANHQLPIASSFWIIPIVSTEECSSLMQNLMQTLCSTCSAILNMMATQYTCSLNGIYHPHWPVKLLLFTHVHSSRLSLAARLHQCCTNHSCYINHGWIFSGQASYFSLKVSLILFFTYFLFLFKYSCLHFPPSTPPAPPIPTSHPWSYPSLALSMCPLYMFLDDLPVFPPLSPLPSRLVTVSLFLISISISLVIFWLFVCFVD